MNYSSPAIHEIHLGDNRILVSKFGKDSIYHSLKNLEDLEGIYPDSMIKLRGSIGFIAYGFWGDLQLGNGLKEGNTEILNYGHLKDFSGKSYEFVILVEPDEKLSFFVLPVASMAFIV